MERPKKEIQINFKGYLNFKNKFKKSKKNKQTNPMNSKCLSPATPADWHYFIFFLSFWCSQCSSLLLAQSRCWINIAAWSIDPLTARLHAQGEGPNSTFLNSWNLFFLILKTMHAHSRHMWNRETQAHTQRKPSPSYLTSHRDDCAIKMNICPLTKYSLKTCF